MLQTDQGDEPEQQESNTERQLDQESGDRTQEDHYSPS